MNNFNYNNYIGEHMSEPLEVLFNGEIMTLSGYMRYKSGNDHIEYFRLSSINDIDYIDCANRKALTPKVKSPVDLTNEELLWVFDAIKITKSYGLYADGDMIFIKLKNNKNNWFNVTTNEFKHCDQDLLNRLYSLHCHINAKELIKNNLAINKTNRIWW